MSTSLNVVSIAAVFCASLRRVAIGLAEPRHLDALFAPLARARAALAGGAELGCGGAGAFACGAGRRGGAALLRLGGGEHVVLGQAAVLAGALDLRRVDMILEHRAAHRRRQGRDRSSLRRPRRGRRLGRMSSPRSAGVSPAPAGLVVAARGGLRRRGSRRAAVASSSIRAITAPTATVSPSLTSCSVSTPGDRRRHFDADLVGLEAGDRLVGRDRLAGLLQPLRERAFGDRFPERRDLDVSGHRSSLYCRRDCAGAAARLLWPSAAAIKAACSAAWRLARPVAGEALASRPAYCGRMPLEARPRRGSVRADPRRSARRRCSSAPPAPRPASCRLGIAFRRLTSGSDGNG